MLGVWVAIFLFLGFPQGWQKIFAIATGLYLIILAYSLSSDATKTTDIRSSFVEHKSTTMPIEIKQTEPVQSVKEDIYVTSEAITESIDPAAQ